MIGIFLDDERFIKNLGVVVLAYFFFWSILAINLYIVYNPNLSSLLNTREITLHDAYGISGLCLAWYLTFALINKYHRVVWRNT